MYRVKELPYKALVAIDFYKTLLEERPSVIAYIALDGHETVGIMVIDGKRLLHLYVVPEARRAGVATELINHFRSITPAEIYVPVSVANREMQAFLVMSGLTLSGRHKLDDSEGLLYIDRKLPDSPAHTNLESNYNDNAKMLLERAYVVEALPVYLTE